MRKLHISILIFIVMIVSNIAMFVSASGQKSTIYCGACGDNLTWTIDDEGVLTISGTGDMLDYEYSLNGARRGENLAPWFVYNYEQVKTNPVRKFNEVVVEEGVTSIGNCAFSYCEAEVFYLPNTVEKIGESAFERCNMYEIVLPQKLTSIGRQAFYSCDYLNNVYVPKSVKLIDSEAFAGCDRLENVTLGEKTEIIGYAAFRECNSLTNIWLPKSLSIVYECAFPSIDFRRNKFNVFFEGDVAEWNEVEVYSNNEGLNSEKTKLICNVHEKSSFEAKYARKLSSDYFEIVGEFCGSEISLFPYTVCEDMIYHGYEMDVDFENRKTIFKFSGFPTNNISHDYGLTASVGECLQIYPSDWKIIIGNVNLGWVYNVGGYTLIKDMLTQSFE